MTYAFLSPLPIIRTATTHTRSLQQCTRYLATPIQQPARAQASSESATTAPKRDRDPLIPAPLNWTEQWYAIAFAVDVPKDEPYAFTVFDTKLVLFRTSQLEFAALADSCPHRLAPLSEGRLTQADGKTEIECAYHGWRFGGCGSCTRIPQNAPDATIPRRANTRSYPTAVVMGIVWIWMGDPKNADEKTIPIPEFARNGLYISRQMLRFMPYGMETLLENVTDSEHVHWAHHGASIYNRRNGGGNRHYVATLGSGDAPFNAMADVSALTHNVSAGFYAPGTVCHRFSISIFEAAGVFFIASPVSLHRSRLLFMSFVKPRTRMSYLPAWSSLAVPRWWSHLTSNMILDGDIVLLRCVEEVFGDPPMWREGTLPLEASMDSFPVHIRKWMDLHRAGMPYLRGCVEVVPERAALIERAESHTKHCAACRGALKVFQRLVFLLNVLVAAAFIAVVTAVTIAALGNAALLNVEMSKTFAWTTAGAGFALLVLFWLRYRCLYYIAQLTNTDEARRLYLFS